VLQREAVVRNFTIDDARRLSTRYLDPSHMIWLVVGDARTQRARLEPLGLGAPKTLDRQGKPVD
jgi:zinc protease